MNDDFYEFTKPVLYTTAVVVGLSLVGTAFASDYGTTTHIKCTQTGTGQEVECETVEVPNRPVVGIDIPFPEEESK